MCRKNWYCFFLRIILYVILSKAVPRFLQDTVTMCSVFFFCYITLAGLCCISDLWSSKTPFTASAIAAVIKFRRDGRTGGGGMGPLEGKAGFRFTHHWLMWKWFIALCRKCSTRHSSAGLASSGQAFVYSLSKTGQKNTKNSTRSVWVSSSFDIRSPSKMNNSAGRTMLSAWV